MTQNELYELVADFGRAYGVAIRRDCYLAKGVDLPENWLELADDIGDARAAELSAGQAAPTGDELQRLILWQVEHAIEEEDPDLVPMIWLCQSPADDHVIAVEGWGTSLHTELIFKLIGHYPDETSAIKDLRLHYIFSQDDL